MQSETRNNQLQIIFIVTYFCNFNCSYCDTVKKKSFAHDSIYNKAKELIIENKNYNRFSVKFFGGEPLFESKKIKRFIDGLNTSKKNINFSITSNGSLLDNKTIDYFVKNSVDLTLSIDGNFQTFNHSRKSSLVDTKKVFNSIIDIDREKKNSICVNMVVTPKNSINFYLNFIYLYKTGFRIFNFLPGAYMNWSVKELMCLQKNFDKIANFLKSNKEEQITIKNISTNNSLFFFNSGIVIDVNGDIYLNNSFLINRFSKFKKEMYIDNINNIKSFDEIFLKFDNSEILQTRYSRIEKYISEISANNNEIDFILSKFVNNLQSV